jgi:hypothetical protein
MLSPSIYPLRRELWFDSALPGAEKVEFLKYLLRHQTCDAFLTPLLQPEICYSLIEVTNIDANAGIMHSCLYNRPLITSLSETFSRSHTSSAEKSPCCPIGSSNGVASVRKASNDPVLSMLIDDKTQSKKLK